MKSLIVAALVVSSFAFATEAKKAEHKAEAKKEEKVVDCSKLTGEEKTKCEAAHAPKAEVKHEEKAPAKK